MTKFDLHMHSIYSLDGEKSVAELVQLAKQAQLNYISLSDHNTMDGVPEAMKLSKDHGIECVPGVELDSFYKDKIFHVLGYGLDPHNAQIKQIYQDICIQEKNAAQERISKIIAVGIDIDEAEVLADAVHGIFVNGLLIAEHALKNPNASKNKLLLPFLEGGQYSNNPYVNFYFKWFDIGQVAYVHIEYIPIQEAIRVIHDAGGIAILAHPGQSFKNCMFWLDEILALDFDGIECFSTYHTTEQNNFYYEKAISRKLLATGGSDYHGKMKPQVKMGEYATLNPELSKRLMNDFLHKMMIVK